MPNHGQYTLGDYLPELAIVDESGEMMAGKPARLRGQTKRKKPLDLTPVENPTLRALMLGAGVQSSRLYLEAALHGTWGIPGTPEYRGPEVAIFADTHAEPEAVYKHLDWLEEQGGHIIPIIRLDHGNLYTEIMAHAEWTNQIKTVKEFIGITWADAQAVYRATGEYLPEHERRMRALGLELDLLLNNRKRVPTPPVFIKQSNGKKGQVMRACTYDKKIKAIIKAIRAHLGMKRGERIPKAVLDKTGVGDKGYQGVVGMWSNMDSPGLARLVSGVVVEQWFGITADEATRMKDPYLPWSRHFYAYIDTEHPVTRGDCLAWLRKHYDIEPPKSACVFCPYRRTKSWMNLKTSDPVGWLMALEVDEAIRNGLMGVDGRAYLSDARVPLSEINQRVQMELDEFDEFGDECSGVCGV